MPKKTIRFHCWCNCYPETDGKFETNDYTIHRTKEGGDPHGSDVVILSSHCPNCQRCATVEYNLADVVEILLTIGE